MFTNLHQFTTNGYLILENFMPAIDCDAVMQRTEELATGFNYNGYPSIFQITEQTNTSDDYFLNSGGNISYFFEKDAFDTNGKLKTNLFQSRRDWCFIPPTT